VTVAAGPGLIDDGEGEDLAGTGRGFRRGRVLRLKKTELALAYLRTEDDLVGGGADLLAQEINLVAKRAGGFVNEAAGDGLELAIVADDVKANELVIAGGSTLRDVEDEGDRSADDEPATHASNEAIQVFFHEAGGSDALDHSA